MISVDDLNPYNEYKVVKKDFSLSPSENLTAVVGQAHTNFNKFQRCVDNKANKWIFTPIINTKRHVVDEKGYEKLLTMAVVTLGTRFIAKRVAPQSIRSFHPFFTFNAFNSSWYFCYRDNFKSSYQNGWQYTKSSFNYLKSLSSSPETEQEPIIESAKLEKSNKSENENKLDLASIAKGDDGQAEEVDKDLYTTRENN